MIVHIPAKLRQQIEERASQYCEYCQAPIEMLLGGHIDHIHPISAGGATTENNLCLTCWLCNGVKNDHQTGIDPETRQIFPLFNPRQQKWGEHFQWDDHFLKILPISTTGRATIEQLKLNRQRFMMARPLWHKAGWRPPG